MNCPICNCTTLNIVCRHYTDNYVIHYISDEFGSITCVYVKPMSFTRQVLFFTKLVFLNQSKIETYLLLK